MDIWISNNLRSFVHRFVSDPHQPSRRRLLFPRLSVISSSTREQNRQRVCRDQFIHGPPIKPLEGPVYKSKVTLPLASYTIRASRYCFQQRAEVALSFSFSALLRVFPYGYVIMKPRIAGFPSQTDGEVFISIHFIVPSLDTTLNRFAPGIAGPEGRSEAVLLCASFRVRQAFDRIR